MPPPRITHRKMFRVLIAGFGMVILLLLAAALVGIRGIRSVQQNAASLLREQSLTRRLIADLRKQQSSLSEVFSILARDPDSLDDQGILSQLAEADRDIDRISAEGAQTPERPLWDLLQQSSRAFSREARRLLSVEQPETFASMDLFRYHEEFTAVVARLIERGYGKVSGAQADIEQRSSTLLKGSAWFAGGSVLLALLFSAFTISGVRHLAGFIELQSAELSRVSWHMLADQEAAARRFSHELHDELGQSLTAIKTNLTALGAGVEGGHARLEDCLKLVDGAIDNVRQMSHLLHPTILDDFGLEAALRWLTEGFSARTGVEARLESNFSGRLEDQTETHLFRIAQEALTNIARHSGATHVEMKLTSGAGEIVLSVHDDGRGLANPRTALDAPLGRGLGLLGMRARARGMGGDLAVLSRPGEGVLIEVRVPLRDETHSHSAG
jgi:signal transduction histidine kinase